MMSDYEPRSEGTLTTTQRRLVYWDIDGTLVSTSNGLAGGLFAEAVSIVLKREVSPVIGDGVGRTDLDIMAETFLGAGVEASEEQLSLALEQLDEISGRLDYASERTLLPGVIEAVEALSREGWTNALVTGNTRRRGFLKVAAFGLSHLFDWERSGFGGSTRVRAEVVASAVTHSYPEGFEITPLIIGDTPADIAAAHENDLLCVAVATGDFDADALAHADLLISDLVSGLPALLDFLLLGTLNRRAELSNDVEH